MVLKGKFSDGADIVAVPNYVRGNRGGQFAVWMKEATPAGQ
jgi:hypothetical protein